MTVANRTDQITIETIKEAMRGANIRGNRELFTHYGGVPQECREAVEVISNNYDEFEELVWKQVSTLPLVEKYFSGVIRTQLEQKEGVLARSILSAVFDEQQRLEHRLENVHKTSGFQAIFQEMGKIEDHPDELERRMLDAWAEIRVIDQLIRDGFPDVHKKVEVGADLVAHCNNQSYAIQVTRIGRVPRFPDLPTGDLGQICGRVPEQNGELEQNGVPEQIGKYFWPSIEGKNLQLKKLSCEYSVRRIAIVTDIPHLQDPLNRHIACQQIRDSVLALEKRYFEEIQWLLDNGNGAVFKIEKGDEDIKIRCLADWNNAPLVSDNQENGYWEINLERDYIG